MVQEFITYAIVFSATLYTFYSTFRFFKPKNGKRTGACAGCAKGSCGGCNLYSELEGRITPQKLKI